MGQSRSGCGRDRRSWSGAAWDRLTALTPDSPRPLPGTTPGRSRPPVCRHTSLPSNEVEENSTDPRAGRAGRLANVLLSLVTRERRGILPLAVISATAFSPCIYASSTPTPCLKLISARSVTSPELRQGVCHSLLRPSFLQRHRPSSTGLAVRPSPPFPSYFGSPWNGPFSLRLSF